MRAPGHYDPANTDTGAAAGACGAWPSTTPDGRDVRGLRRDAVNTHAPTAEDPEGWTRALAQILDYQTRPRRTK